LLNLNSVILLLAILENSMNSNLTNLPTLELLSVDDWTDYRLLDTGDGQKLEQCGAVRLIRPEAEAVWSRRSSEVDWQQADAWYKPAPEENGGHWEFNRKVPERWLMSYRSMRFWAQTSASRHLGVFPEQASQWNWLAQVIHAAGGKPKVLNLFGYTGIASLAAAQAGAQVTHLDASRKVVTWANENQKLSNLSEAPIRWIIDDALKFVQREHRRGVTYDGIILDPPKFGRGPKGEVWEFYKLIPELLEACRLILSPDPLFVQLTAYAVKASAVTLYYAVDEMMREHPGKISTGELGLLDESAGRFLSMAIFTRWRNSKISLPPGA
jgi:23S rRNA (cytosine1962-C5)-methyltransferase